MKNIKKSKNDELRDYLYNHMVNFYLNVFQVAKLYRRKYKFFIQKGLLKGKGQTAVNKIRIVLFRVSPTVYYAVNGIRKMFYIVMLSEVSYNLFSVKNIGF